MSAFSLGFLSRSLSSAKKYPQGSGGMGFKAPITRLTLEAATFWYFVGTITPRMRPPLCISPSSRMQLNVIPRTSWTIPGLYDRNDVENYLVLFLVHPFRFSNLPGFNCHSFPSKWDIFSRKPLLKTCENE